MRCEVCGHKIHGSPVRALIEGAKLTVCTECAKHGKVIPDEPAPKPALAPARRAYTPVPAKRPTLKATVDTTQEIVEGYASQIRQAREKLGFSHEDLGKKINEKASVLRKIETGSLSPNNQLVTKLERTLHVKLLVPVAEEKTPPPQISKAASRELTLGDLITLGKKGTEEPTQRKQS